jgi:hypothetical protein
LLQILGLNPSERGNYVVLSQFLPNLSGTTAQKFNLLAMNLIIPVTNKFGGNVIKPDP